ncbi:hypothetical protein DD238_002571 [Peronospora effusa]|uniref:Myb-like domain-containing protein n=1 Tax=Peronospora effusa TaxID=542832 RepID=A0A3M6VI16_9STRA|nr:hypothetical protein DD238_002571 [Peronospora effusa]
MIRSVSAPLRRSRYSSVLESALVGLGREDAIVQSTRKPRKKWRLDTSKSPIRGLCNVASAPERHLNDDVKKKRDEKEEEEEDPFEYLRLLKSHQKKKKKRKKREEEEEEKKNVTSSPAVTRSAAKQKKKHYKRRCSGVLEMVARTPVTRSMVKEKKKWKRSSLERIQDVEIEEDDDVVIQKKLFQSPQDMRKIMERGEHKRERVSRKAVVLEHWCVEWPPVLERKYKRDVEKAQLVLTGQVDGIMKRFVVGKREGATKFTSKDGEYVTLSGKLDRNAAKCAGIPRKAVELMDVGIPAYFNNHLLPYAQKSRDNVKHGKTGSKSRLGKKKATGADKYGSPPLIEEGVNNGTEAIIALASTQHVEAYSMPKPKKTRVLPIAKEKRMSTKKEEPEPEAEGEVWTTEQQEALMDAKLQIPTTAPNFWVQVAQYVPGKSAKDCQAKTFEHFRSPLSNRKSAKRPTKKRASTEPHSAVPTKIARAGSNKFKKQVRDFVEEVREETSREVVDDLLTACVLYEKKHVDDLFETTPSKEGLPELPVFDSIKSPELGGTPSRSFDDNDSEMDDETPGLLKKLSSRRRDDIDSYVLGINRQHVAGGGVMAGGKVRRLTSLTTPVKAVKTKAMSAKKKAVMLVEEVGSHSLKGVVSPGGTTYVRIQKDGSSSEGEEAEDSNEEEEDFDLP